MKSKWFVAAVALFALIALWLVSSRFSPSRKQESLPPATNTTTPRPTSAAVPKNLFFTHNSADKTWVDSQGRLRGKPHAGRRAFSIELLHAMAEVRGQAITIEDVPFKRGFTEVQQGTANAIFSVVRTAERESTVKWVGPLHKDNGYWYELVSRPTGVTSLEEAHKVDKIAVVDGTITLNFMRKHKFENLVLTNSYKACFTMLKAGRVQLTGSTPRALPTRLAEAGLKPEEVKPLPFVLFEVAGYLAFRKDTPDSEIAAWQAALEKLHSTGAYKKLVDDYLDD